MIYQLTPVSGTVGSYPFGLKSANVTLSASPGGWKPQAIRCEAALLRLVQAAEL